MNHLSLFSLRLLAFTSVSNLASESWTIPFSDFSCDFWDNRSTNHSEAGHLVLLTLNGLFCKARKLICLNGNERDNLLSFVLSYVCVACACMLTLYSKQSLQVISQRSSWGPILQCHRRMEEPLWNPCQMVNFVPG
ncbi:Hypothetical predicted protein [Podarcis lilfordi]|uniref:Uncharacterized protein n=1 Tax=Podarcis lilfordi TaxID=74358 RepID=A0AA35KUS8_9SAUR|nr:Hypothetical predicted protein [Podarcis lilfordi]